jgi:hypothetical protein
MKEAGWEFLRTDEKNRKVFTTPVRKGKRRTISQKRDLDEQDRKYAKILFPGKNEVDLILQEEMTLQVGQEDEVHVGQEGQLDVGQEGQLDEGQEGQLDVEQEDEAGDLPGEHGGEELEIELHHEPQVVKGNGGEEEEQVDESTDLQLQLEPGSELENPESNHEMALTAVAKKVEEMVNNFELTTINIDECLEYLEIGLMTKEHPFHETFESNSNFFVKAIDFGLMNSRALLYTIARGMFTLESLACMDAHKVIKLAFIFTNIVCSRSPNFLCGFKKKVSVFAQACGMSNDGLNVLATLGITETSK